MKGILRCCCFSPSRTLEATDSFSSVDQYAASIKPVHQAPQVRGRASTAVLQSRLLAGYVLYLGPRCCADLEAPEESEEELVGLELPPQKQSQQRLVCSGSEFAEQCAPSLLLWVKLKPEGALDTCHDIAGCLVRMMVLHESSPFPDKTLSCRTSSLQLQGYASQRSSGSQTNLHVHSAVPKRGTLHILP